MCGAESCLWWNSHTASLGIKRGNSPTTATRTFFEIRGNLTLRANLLADPLFAFKFCIEEDTLRLSVWGNQNPRFAILSAAKQCGRDCREQFASANDNVASRAFLELAYRRRRIRKKIPPEYQITPATVYV